MKNNYYVYIHVSAKSDLPFYVGMGKDNRIRSKSGRNKGWKEVVRLEGYYFGFIKENLSFKEANDFEKLTIYYFRNNGFNLVNLSSGGSGNQGCKLPPRSEEHRRKLSESQRGKKRGKIHTEESIRKFSEKLKGRKKPQRSESHKKNLSLSLMGRNPWNKNRSNIYSEQTLEKMSRNNASNKSIVVFDQDENLLFEFVSISEASKELKINRNKIWRILKGIQKPEIYIFKYNYEDISKNRDTK